MLMPVRTGEMLTARQVVLLQMLPQVATFHQVSLLFLPGVAPKSGNHHPPDPLEGKGDTGRLKAMPLAAGMEGIKDSNKEATVEGSSGVVMATTHKVEEDTMPTLTRNTIKASTNSSREVKVRPPLTVHD